MVVFQEEEQEAEQEKQEEVVPEVEEASSLKYSRSDETPRPWLLSSLAQPPQEAAQGFYVCSKFSVYSRLQQKLSKLQNRGGATGGMPFPPYLLMSSNHYKAEWSSSAPRRLKNVVIVMQWLPDWSVSRGLSAEQASLLARAFKCFADERSHTLSERDLPDLLKAIALPGADSLGVHAMARFVKASILRRRATQPPPPSAPNPPCSSTQRNATLPRPQQEQPGASSSFMKLSSPNKTLSSLSALESLWSPCPFPHSSQTAPPRAAASDPLEVFFNDVSSEPNKNSNRNNSGLSLGLQPAASPSSKDDLLDLFAGISSSSPQTWDLPTASPPAQEAKPQSASPPSSEAAGVGVADSGKSASSQVVGRSQDLRFSLAEVESALGEEALSAEQEGRYFVVLTLQEAEGVRAALHAQQTLREASLVSRHKCCVALHNLAADFQVLDGSPFFRRRSERLACAIGFQQQTAHACLRFLNSCLQYAPPHLPLLLRCLQKAPCKDRQDFFFAVRRSRRRRQNVAWQELPLARLFLEEDDAASLQFRALLSKLRQRLSLRRLSATDAFRQLDVLCKGEISHAQLISGLEWLGLRLETYQHADVCRRFDLDGDCLISENDFVLSVGESPDNAGVAGTSQTKDAEAAVAALSGGNASSSSLKTQLDVQASRAGAPPQPRPHSVLEEFAIKAELSAEVLARIRLRLQPHTTFAKIWEGNVQASGEGAAGGGASAVSSAVATLSVWSPKQLESRHRGMMRRNRERVCLGHYVCFGGDMGKALQNALSAANSPRGWPSSQTLRMAPQVIEVSDGGVSAMAESPILSHVVECLFPLPCKYKVFWRQSASKTMQLLNAQRSTAGASGGGSQSCGDLTLWTGVPPSAAFVCVGLAATAGGTPPLPNALRCVPAKWLRQTTLSQRLGEVAGSGRESALSLWSIGKLGLLGAALHGADGTMHRGESSSTFFGWWRKRCV